MHDERLTGVELALIARAERILSENAYSDIGTDLEAIRDLHHRMAASSHRAVRAYAPRLGNRAGVRRALLTVRDNRLPSPSFGGPH